MKTIVISYVPEKSRHDKISKHFERLSETKALEFQKNGDLFVASNYRFDDDGSCRIVSRVDKKTGRSDYSALTIRIDKNSEWIEIETDEFWGIPFYYYMENGVFLASNSLSTLMPALASMGIQPQIDEWACVLSIVTFYVPPSTHCIRGIKTFPYGQNMRISLPSMKMRKERTISPNFQKNVRTWGELSKEYVTEFEKVADEAAASDSIIWLMYTGGLDSSILLSRYAKMGMQEKIKAVTVYNPLYPTEDDVNAMAITKRLGFERIMVPLEESDFFSLPETLWANGDPTEIYGYGISLLKAARNPHGIKDFVNGAGTDAAIWATPVVLAALWNVAYEPENLQWTLTNRKFESDRTKNGSSISDMFTSKVVDSQSWIDEISRVTFHMQNNTSCKPSDIKNQALACRFERSEIYSDSFGMSDMGLELHDLFVLLDYDGLAHRFGDLYKNMATYSDTTMTSPFANRRLREIIFQSPLDYKFNPTYYETTFRDNQFFYKKSLWEYVPEEIKSRKKRNGSVPDIRAYLNGESTNPYAKKLFARFYERNIFEYSYLSKLEKLWDYSRIKWKNVAEIPKSDTLAYTCLVTVWRIVVLETYLELYLDGKGKEMEDSGSFDLRELID